MDKTKREEVCKECGQLISGKTFNSFNHFFNNHIRKVHGMKKEDYLIKHELNGNSPKCACGCGNRVKFIKGIFLKYYLDHKNKMKLTEEQKKDRKSKTIKVIDLEYRLKKTGITREMLEESYEVLCKHEKSLAELSRDLVIDKRTLTDFWDKAGIIKDKVCFQRVLKKSQGYWKYKICPPTLDEFEKLESLWPSIMEFIVSSKNKRTITEVIRVFDLKIGYNYIFDRIQEKYGFDFVKQYLKLCQQSKIELEFFNILRFYFPHSIKKQFNLNGKIYDYILGKRMLIELDGIYWHSLPKNIENDKKKDELAKENGYYLLRIGEKEVTDINVLVKIKETYEKIQASGD